MLQYAAILDWAKWEWGYGKGNMEVSSLIKTWQTLADR
jgi:hypothetical protein